MSEGRRGEAAMMTAATERSTIKETSGRRHPQVLLRRLRWLHREARPVEGPAGKNQHGTWCWHCWPDKAKRWPNIDNSNHDYCIGLEAVAKHNVDKGGFTLVPAPEDHAWNHCVGSRGPITGDLYFVQGICDGAGPCPYADCEPTLANCKVCGKALPINFGRAAE